MKNTILKSIVFILALQVHYFSSANFQEDYKNLLKRHGISEADISISVTKKASFKSWDPVLNVNDKTSRIPASLTKILTAITALDVLPKDHKFVTEFKALSKPSKGVLKGDIYLVGSGDPTLVSEKLWLLVRDLKRWNINKIDGNVIYDDHIFDQVRFSETRTTKNHRAYSSPTSGLSFNWNSLWIRIFPEDNGQQARVYLDPPDSSILIKNNAKTGGTRTNLLVDRVTENKIDYVLVNGRIKNDDEFSVYRSHTKPSERAGIQAYNLLKQEGVVITGAVKKGKTPSSAIQIAKSESIVIDEVVKLMMKFSNNLISEMLIKYVDHFLTSNPGTLKGGMQTLEKVSRKYTAEKFNIENPSGLTDKNKLTSKMLTEILGKAYSQPEYGPEFIASFPRSGIDGTIKKRMLNAKGLIRAKTGLLNGVIGLAGYAHSNNGNVYSFTFIFNGPVKKQGRAKDLFDLLGERLALKY